MTINFEFIYIDMMKKLKSKRKMSTTNRYAAINACEQYAQKFQKYEDLGELNVLKNNQVSEKK